MMTNAQVIMNRLAVTTQILVVLLVVANIVNIVGKVML